MASTNLTIRIDSGLKARAAEVAEYYGLELSSAIRAFCTEMVNTYSVPLSFKREVPNAATVAALRDAESIVGDDGPAYEDGAALLRAALG